MSVCPIVTYGSFQQKNISLACTIHTPNKHIMLCVSLVILNYGSVIIITIIFIISYITHLPALNMCCKRLL